MLYTRPPSSKNTSHPSPLLPVVVENDPVVGCAAFASVEAICLPDESVPSLTSGPSAFTNRMAAHPAGVVGAVVVHAVWSVEKDTVQPEG